MAKIDLKTRDGRETEVLKQIAQHAGFSIFWATDNQKRANAICRLEQRNAIKRGKNSHFPWCDYHITAWK